jgi:hypothetical protein
VKINLALNASESTFINIQSWILALVESIVIVSLVTAIIFFLRKKKTEKNRRKR